MLIGLGYGQTNQNFCGTRTDPNQLIFVNDPSGCRAYLWCFFDGNNVLQSVHQGTCPEGFSFNEGAGACDAQLLCDEIPCLGNTGTIRVRKIKFYIYILHLYIAFSIKIADPSDNECRSFRTCTDENAGEIITCNAPSVFNRNFGICTNIRLAPCSESRQKILLIFNETY